MPVKKDYTDPNTRCKNNHDPDWYTSPNGWTVCKACRREQVSKYQKKHPERYKEYQRKNYADNIDKRRAYDKERSKTPERRRQNKSSALKIKYGLPYEEYQAMWNRQNGLCEICSRPLLEIRGSKGAAVDHDHATGKVRDILCGRCNSVIGFCEEDVTLMQKFIGYVEKHKTQERPN